MEGFGCVGYFFEVMLVSPMMGYKKGSMEGAGLSLKKKGRKCLV